MEKNSPAYKGYIQILKEELVPALGCTEPIAIAYAAAKATTVLGQEPDEVVMEVSANIIKNVKSVVVPNTGGLRGIEAAAAAGIVAGKADKELEVICDVSEDDKARIREFMQTKRMEVLLSKQPFIVFIEIRVKKGEDRATVRIANRHTNVVYIEKNGEVQFEKEVEVQKDDLTDRTILNVKEIVEFAGMVEFSEIEALVARQMVLNRRIAWEGLSGAYGANIGKLIMARDKDGVASRAKAMAAAASDARMNGCELPVVIISGSGNQGVTTCLPVVEYAEKLGVTREELYRAIVLSDLVTIHLKTGIGRLSAYCGAVSAGCGSGAAIAYLHEKTYEAVAHTIVNALAIASGMVCDGAKASCAAKIAVSVEAGILGYYMYQDGNEFSAGDGLVTTGVEETIRNIGRLAREGMSETDKEILGIMVGDQFDV